MHELVCPNCGKAFRVDEATYASILSQVKGAEFNAEVDRRIAELHRQQEAEEQARSAEAEKEHQNELFLKEKEITEKDAEIARLKADAEVERSRTSLQEKSIREDYENRLKVAQEQVDYYKDLKARMSTKMVGESLEVHCSTIFNGEMRPMFPHAYFEKDNDASGGSKGDFIFRDYDGDTEYISIMFEMKNEMDTTATKHKNDDFLKKLDEDRRKKGCEFAVLVSLLEADNDLYNNGIVNKSHLYPKMYVIRPQFFVPFINLLVQASKKSLEYKKQLLLAQSKEVDVTNFESKIEDFKSKFGRHYQLASTKFEAAIKDIDATISKLQKVRDELVGSNNNLRLANQDTDDLTIRKLTFKNPTMKAKFEEARKKGESSAEGDDIEE